MAVSENKKDNGKVRMAVWAMLLGWLLLAFILGAGGIFVEEPGVPPLPILAGVLTPLVVFLIAFRLSNSFHEFVMSVDLQLAAGMQAWRFAGFGFIALYAYGVLPGQFAWPAGLGDMAIGVTAVWVMLALRDRPNFAASRLFRVWNLLGILDLVVAISVGATNAFYGIGTSGAITTFPMAQLPLVLIPVYLVPLFLMLHIASLLQSRHLAEAGEKYRWACPPVYRGPTETPA